MIMLICGEESIREIIPFPMNKNAMDIMMGEMCIRDSIHDTRKLKEKFMQKSINYICQIKNCYRKS